MRLRKLIQKSNTLIVLLSLVTLFTIIFLFVSFLSMTIIDTIENDEIVDSDIFAVKKLLDDFNSTEFTSLEMNLNKMGYNLVVIQNEKMIHASNADLNDELEELFIRDTDNDLYAIFHKNSWTIIRKNLIESNTKVYAVYGSDANGFFTLSSGSLQIYLLYILFIGVFSIAGLIIISYVFTKRMVKRIMKPVDLLMEGVKRVENNDLTQRIEYQGEFEFERLCQSFNEMQENLLEEMKKNTAYDKSRRDMISGISHDLRTPLTSIKGFLQGMKEGVANTSKKREQYIEICYKKANEMDELLKQLSYYTKVEAQVMPFHFEEVDLGRIVQHLVESKQEDFTDDTQLICQIPNKHLTCMIDPDQFYRAFINIIENSINYAMASSLVINVTLVDTIQDYQLIIADNGVGIEEDKLDLVFNQFYRGDEYRNSQIEGSGLGLYITKEIISRHNGNIMAENDNGFKVTITLPKERSYDA